MELFLSAFLLCLSLCLDLGIVNIAIIKSGVEKGFFHSMKIGIGSTFGDLVYASLSVYGISRFIEQIWVRWALWIAGTLFLMAMGIRMLARSMNRINTIGKPPKIYEKLSGYGPVAFGIALALSSPTSILWFATVGGSMIASKPIHSKFDILYFLAGFFAASLIWSVLLAWLSHSGGKLIKGNIRTVFSLLSAVLFLILAIFIFIDGWRSLL
ncbi:MAG TPA: LysE family transporter [Cyclobacteriaceae bacterium]|nr:LysE family transporter [Cyclobacteriaceae bacterium]